MLFLSLMKATPDISLVKVNDTTSELELPTNPGTVNPYDEYTIEECIRLRERFGGKCAVLCVGSDKSEVALRECLALGVDEAYLAVDPLFDGSDSQATAKILSAALKKIGDYTIVLGGKQSADFESSQTPAALAVLSGNPGINSVKKIEDIINNTVSVRRATDSGYEIVEAPTPVILSCLKEIAEPRLPSLKGKMAAKKKPITKWSASDLGLDGSGIGSNSPSKVLKVSSPPSRAKGEFIEGSTPEEIAENIYQKLKADQAL